MSSLISFFFFFFDSPLQESIAKEKEDTKEPLQVNEGDMEDDISLFYSDIMPLLVSKLKKL